VDQAQEAGEDSGALPNLGQLYQQVQEDPWDGHQYLLPLDHHHPPLQDNQLPPAAQDQQVNQVVVNVENDFLWMSSFVNEEYNILFMIFK